MEKLEGKDTPICIATPMWLTYAVYSIIIILISDYLMTKIKNPGMV